MCQASRSVWQFRGGAQGAENARAKAEHSVKAARRPLVSGDDVRRAGGVQTRINKRLAKNHEGVPRRPLGMAPVMIESSDRNNRRPHGAYRAPWGELEVLKPPPGTRNLFNRR